MNYNRDSAGVLSPVDAVGEALRPPPAALILLVVTHSAFFHVQAIIPPPVPQYYCW